MKTRLCRSLTAIFLLVSIIFSLFGCQKCEHDWVVKEMKEATCDKKGWVLSECSLCGETSFSEIPYGDHKNGYRIIDKDDSYHWQICSVCVSPFDKQEHVWNSENLCSICGYSNRDTTNKKETITLWVSEVDGATDLAKAQVARFLEAHPEYKDKYDIKIEGVYEANAASGVLADVASAPDIYCFFQDQLARLVQAYALAALPNGYPNNIIANNDSISITAATVGDTLYAYPMTSENGCYLYYDKSIVTDPSSLEAIVAACVGAGKKFSFELENAWYTASFFIGVGCRSEWIFDNDIGEFTGVNDNYNSDLGVIAMKGMQIVTKSPAYYNSSSDFEASAAVVTGIWNANIAKEAYGDNLGVCELPTFTVDGTTYHLGSFSGNRLMGVKPQTDPQRSQFCHALAEYLTSEECQLERYNEFNWGPSNLKAQANENVKTNIHLQALKAQNEYAIPQGNINGYWWNTVGRLGSNSMIADTEEDIRRFLAEYEAEIHSWFDNE